MKQFFDNYLNAQSPESRNINAAQNVNQFIDELDKTGLAYNFSNEEYLGHIHKFVQHMNPKDDGQKWIDEFSEKVTNFRADSAREVLKVHVYSHLVDDKKLQQDFAAHQVLNFCKRDSSTTSKYGSKETQRLGENITQILSPLAKDDKKTLKAIKDTSSITAREAISIMSEVDHNVQLNKWQKFLHNTIDRLKGIFVNEKIHDVVKGYSFKRITEKLDDGRQIKPFPITTTKSNIEKDKKQNTLAGR